MRKIVFMLSLIYIFIIPWEGVIDLPALGTMAKLIGFVLAAFWVTTVVLTNKLRKPGLFQIAVLIFVCWNALSVLWSRNPNRTVAHVMTWVQLLGMVLILWDLYNTRTALLAGLQAYVLGAYVAVGSAVANFFSGNPYYTHYQRFSPGDMHPDGFGLILSLSIPVAWYLGGATLNTKWSGLLKIINYAYIPTALFGLSLSGTRTSLLASTFGMAFGIASLTRIRLWVRVAIIPLLALAILSLLPFVQTLKSFQRFGTIAEEITEGDLNSRTTHWSEGYSTFLENPLLGIGANMYRSVTSRGNLAHNSFISVLVESGLVGFALFGFILAIVGIKAWNQPRWESAFWLTTLLVWAIGASSLTYEHRRATWLFLSLIIASAALTPRHLEAVPLTKYNESDARVIPHDTPLQLLPGDKEKKPYLV